MAPPLAQSSAAREGGSRRVREEGGDFFFCGQDEGGDEPEGADS